MGGVISSLRGKSPDPRAVTPTPSERKAEGKHGVGAKAGGMLSVRRVAGEPAIGLARRTVVAQRGYRGDITPTVRQVNTGQAAHDFRDNLALLLKNASKLGPGDLEATMREITQNAPARWDVDPVVHQLIAHQPALSRDQLWALGRGLCDGRGLDTCNAVLVQVGQGAVVLKLRQPAAELAGGALSTFNADPDDGRDRLSQQISLLLKLNASHARHGAPFEHALLGALVHERGLDDISPEDYERICHVAAHQVFNQGNEYGHTFSWYIPGKDHPREQIATLFETYRKLHQVERRNELVEPFYPTYLDEPTTRPVPAVAVRPARPESAAAKRQAGLKESKSKSESKSAGGSDTLPQEVANWFMQNPAAAEKFFADRAKAKAKPDL